MRSAETWAEHHPFTPNGHCRLNVVSCEQQRAYVCVCVCEKLQGQMHSAFNECGPKGTWVVKTESWRDYFVPCYLTLLLHL